MAKLSLQFKQKHMGYCASFMMDTVMGQFFYVANAVRNQLLSGTYGAEDLISIDIDSDNLVALYNQLGEKSERTGSFMNSDMKATLLPQLMTIAQGSTDQTSVAQDVLQQLSNIDAQNVALRDQLVNKGIEWLTQ